MPETKKPAAAKKPKAKEPEAPDSTLVSVAKAIGHAAGELAVKTGIEKPPTKSSKIPKLAPKNKKRLPRREKKALQKSTASRV
jgi:hypothetical protein